jgi:hypothetical protein
MLYSNVVVMKEKLLQVQQLIKHIRRVKKKEKKNKTCLRLLRLLIHSYSLVSCLLKMLIKISIIRTPLRRTP